jgi:hypothetical protein
VSSTWRRIGRLAGSMLGLSLGVCAPPADAGVFRVHTCNTPDYERALGPTIQGFTGETGWLYEATYGVPAVIQDDCPSGGPFQFWMPSGSSLKAGDFIGAAWTAAPDTRLIGFAMRWNAGAANSPGRNGGTSEITLATDRDTILRARSPWTAPANSGGANYLASALLDASRLEMRFTCLDACTSAEPYWLRGWVAHASFDVRDDAAPAGGLIGPGVDARAWSGVMHLGFNAADAGGGLYRAIVEVDGSTATSQPLAPSGKCEDIGPDPSIPEFAAPQPCPLRIDGGTLDIDTRDLPQGDHSVRILIEDVSGNRSAIFGPVLRHIDAQRAVGPGSDPVLRGAANGDAASDQATLTAHWGKRSQRTLLVSRFGRTHVVRGRLRAQDGAPIANATIDVISKTTANDARELAKRGGPRTGSDGSWYLVLPRRVSSRTVTLHYRSHVNDTIPSATASVRLRVRAGLRLAIAPRRARRGEAIHFSGRLLGAPLPRGGKQIVLMARASRGAWVRFNVVRSDRRGRFRATYRFQRPGAASYRFRALSLAEAAYPYLAGGSNVVVVSKR